METNNLITEFEHAAARAKNETAPDVRVAARVMRVIQSRHPAPNRVFEALAFTSLLLATAAILVGFSTLTETAGSLDAFFQIVPPIGP